MKTDKIKTDKNNESKRGSAAKLSHSIKPKESKREDNSSNKSASKSTTEHKMKSISDGLSNLSVLAFKKAAPTQEKEILLDNL